MSGVFDIVKARMAVAGAAAVRSSSGEAAESEGLRSWPWTCRQFTAPGGRNESQSHVLRMEGDFPPESTGRLERLPHGVSVSSR